MAKKKNENALSYLQMPLPSGGKYSKMTKISFGGLNKRHDIDSGELSMANNISTNEYPYLTPSEKRKSILFDRYENPISMFGFDDFLVVVYGDCDDKGNVVAIKIDYIGEYNTPDQEIYTSILKNVATVASYEDMVANNNTEFEGYHFVLDEGLYYIYKDGEWKEIQPGSSIVQFNVYDTPTDPVAGKYVKKLLIFPDKKSMDFKVTEDNFEIKDMDVLIKAYENDKEPYLPPDTASHNYYYQNTSGKAKEADTLYGAAIYQWVDDESDTENSGWKISVPPTMPDIKYATVHLSRVFGVDDDRVYASGFNDYANWNLDTIDEYNEANAWCSPSQSNTKAGGNFTGITTFQGHVICFKHDFMHEIYNTKNPFRLQDIYAEGAIDNRTIQDVDGKLIFVSEDDVKIYTGSNPRIIGYKLNMPRYTYAVSGTDNRNYYLYCEDSYGDGYLYVYDTYTDLWSEQNISSRVLSFAHNKRGMFMLLRGGYIFQMDTENYATQQWSFETELITNQTVNIKHIKKLQMLVDIPQEENSPSARFDVYVLYDNEVFDDMESEEKDKRLVYSSKGKSGRLPIRVKPRKTANYGFKLHVEGKGYFKLHELEIFIESGGDMYV